MSVDKADFEYIAKLVHERSAIVLEPGKEYLVDARLTPVARREGFSSLDDLIAGLKSKPFGPLHRKVVEAMTTNETSFFRDIHPFEALKKRILPEMIEKRSSERKLTIWCGACSSGQEPYTLAMILWDAFPVLSSWTVRFIASDISTEMLQRAQEGFFSQMEVNRGLPAMFLVKYFEQKGSEWRVKEQIRRMIEFKEINLASDWPMLPPMDVILVRNVMIYFSVATKKAILGKVRRILKPDGYLLLGGSETTMNLDDAFERVLLENTGCYRLPGAEKGKMLAS